MMARAVCTSATCCSSERVPRADVAITEPMAASTATTTASATSTSMIVKPAVDRRPSQGIARNNLDSSGQPVDPNLIADTEPCQRDDAAARHAGREESDGGKGRTLV